MENELIAWRTSAVSGQSVSHNRLKRFSPEQRVEALQLFERAKSAGVGVLRAAELLGVTDTSLRRWRETEARFPLVKVVREERSAAAVRVTIKSLRAELSVEQLAELVERLS